MKTMMNSNSGRKFGNNNNNNNNNNNRQGGGGIARNGPRRNRWNDNRQRLSNSNRNSGVQMGLLGNRPMVSPWESGLTPGMQQQTGFQSTFPQQSSFMPFQSNARNSNSFGGSNFSSVGSPNKMRRIERNMGDMDDHRGRGLLPSPGNAPLLGAAPSSFAANREHLFQQRLGGNMWNSSFQSNVSKGLSNSSYFPSKRVGSASMRQQPFRANNAIKDRLDRSASNNKNKFRKRLVPRPRTEPKKSDSSSNDKAQDLDKEKAESTNDGEVETKEDFDASDNEDNEVKEDSSSEIKDDSTRTRTDNNKEDSLSKKDVENRKVDDYPSEALYCSICELDKFSSKKGYVRHLQGLTHAKMAELYHAKNAATLELLNASAKLSNMRQRDKNLRRTGIRRQQMDKTTEQIVLQRWLRYRTCCGIKLKSQFEREEHKLSLNHLKNVYETKQKKEAKTNAKNYPVMPEDEETNGDAVMESFRIIEEACKKEEKTPLSSANIQPFDPTLMFGLQYMSRYLKFRCSICKGPLQKDLEGHCKSHRHYETIVELITKTEADKKNKEKEDAKAKERDIAKAKRDEENEEKDTDVNEEETEETEEPTMVDLLEEAVVDDDEDEDEEAVVDDEDEEMKDDDEPDSQDPNADYIMVDCSDESPKPPHQEMDDEINAEEEDIEIISKSKDDCDEVNILDEVGERIDFDVLELENEISAAPVVVEEKTVETPCKATPTRRGLRSRRT